MMNRHVPINDACSYDSYQRRIVGTYPERGSYCSGWKITDAELTALKSESPMLPLCYNAHSKVGGSVLGGAHGGWVVSCYMFLLFIYTIPVSV